MSSDNVNRDPETPGAVTREQMDILLAQVLARMGEKDESLEEAVEAVVGRRDMKLIAYAQGRS